MFSQQNSDALYRTSPSTGTRFPLVFKYGLALASVVAYALLAQLADALDSIEGFPDAGQWFHYVVGAIFGALVLGPYVGPRQRAIRVLLLAAASAVIYYVAVWFVVDGPIGTNAITSFVIAGAGAALLCGLATLVIAPCMPDWRLVPLALGAGALGGATFNLNLSFDPNLLVAHAVWQLLVCLALHLSLRDRPALAAAA